MKSSSLPTVLLNTGVPEGVKGARASNVAHEVNASGSGRVYALLSTDIPVAERGGGTHRTVEGAAEGRSCLESAGWALLDAVEAEVRSLGATCTSLLVVSRSALVLLCGWRNTEKCKSVSLPQYP